MRAWLIKERKSRKRTQLDLASEIGISRAYLAQIELGARNPSVRVARKLAQALSFEWTRFFDEPDAKTDQGCSEITGSILREID